MGPRLANEMEVSKRMGDRGRGKENAPTVENRRSLPLQEQKRGQRQAKTLLFPRPRAPSFVAHSRSPTPPPIRRAESRVVEPSAVPPVPLSPLPPLACVPARSPSHSPCSPADSHRTRRSRSRA